MHIPCYIISLEREIEKRDTLINSLNKRGIVPQHFKAILGKDLPSDLYPYTPRGVLGCAMSHIEVAKMFLETTHEYCLVLEDDAVPLFDNKEDIIRVIKNAPKDAQSILLYCMMYCFNNKIADVDNIKYYRSLFPVSGAAYILSRAGAFIQKNIKPYFHIDYLRVDSNMVIYSIQPALFDSPPIDTNSSTRSSKNVGFLKKAVFDGGLDLNEVGKFKLLRLPFANNVEIDTITFTISLFFLFVGIACLVIYYINLHKKKITVI